LRLSTAVTAGQVAALVGGEVIGVPERTLAGVAPLDAAGPGDLAFAAGPGSVARLAETRAGAILVPSALATHVPPDATAIVVPAPVDAVQRVIAEFGADRAEWGIHPSATIGSGTRWTGRIRVGPAATIGRDVRLGAGCQIGAGSVIEDGARLGAGCRVEAQVTIHRDVVLGDRVVVRTGARIGGPGFGYVLQDGRHVRVPQLAGCRIEDDVEIGANTAVDRGATRDTVVGAGSKIDNLVQVAHNVRIGSHCIVMAQVGIAGSSVVEDEVMLAGQAGLADHLTVGKGSRVAAQVGVIGNVAPGATVSGYPARDHRSVLRQTAALARLTPLVDTLERIAQHDE